MHQTWLRYFSFPHVNRIICLQKICHVSDLLSFNCGPVSEVVYCSVDNDQDFVVVAVNLKGLVVILMMIMLQDTNTVFNTQALDWLVYENIDWQSKVNTGFFYDLFLSPKSHMLNSNGVLDS